MNLVPAFILVSLLPASAPASALESGAPPGLTLAARPTYRLTPSADRDGRADLDLESGLSLLDAGRPGPAVRDFLEAVRLEPDAANFKALGEAYAGLGDDLKAVWAYQESLRLKPDAEVRARMGALLDKRGPAVRTRYRALMGRAAAEAARGDALGAVKDYTSAYGLGAGAESAGPALRLAADAVEGALKRGDLPTAVEWLCRVGALRRAADGGDGDAGVLKRLDRAQTRVERWSGMNLRDNHKAMLADHGAWIRALRARESFPEPGA